MEIWSAADDGSIGRDAPGYDYRNTWTGYYIRKGLSSSQNRNYNPNNPGNTGAADGKCNPLLRRCEVWMNLAEALNEYAGPMGTAPGIDPANTPVAIIKRLRSLYGTGNAYVDEIAGNKDEFAKLILNERRIEFAFENMRLWDIRRRRMPEFHEPILGVKIYAEYVRTDVLPNDDERRIYNYTYFGTSPGVDDIEVQVRNLDDPKFYTSPIPYNEMMKNPNLVQNAGWELLKP